MVSKINEQDFLVFKSTLTDQSTDQMCVFYGPGCGKNGSVNIPLFQQMPDWKRIIVEVNSTTVTGGSTPCAFTGVTSCDSSASLTSSSVAAKDGDGSTAFASGTITAAGRTIFSMVREEATTCTNIGAVLGFLFDKTTLTTYTGEIIVYVTR